MTMRTVAGKWRGNYQYNDAPDEGSSFTADFSETSGRLKGTIVDDYAPCEALIGGTFSFPAIQFTKVYATGEVVRSLQKKGDQFFVLEEDYANPVEYEGLMSNDGKTMNGTWHISLSRGKRLGTWTAHRLSEEEERKERENARRIEHIQFDQHQL